MKKFLLGIMYLLSSAIFIQAQTLYGTTGLGGNGGGGSINKFLPSTNELTVVKSFERLAYYPYNNRFIQASDGKLYGTTLLGGSYNLGVIFSFDPFSSTYTNLKQFNSTDGFHCYQGLIQARDGKLYGTAFWGGSENAGVIFSFDPSNFTYAKLKNFNTIDGANPMGSLTEATDGKLYGTTIRGGSHGVGVIFSFDPSTFTYTKLKDFDTINGASPRGSLVQAMDGKLYGMTAYGGSGANSDFLGYGVIFSYDPSSFTYTKLKDLDLNTGVYPLGGLTRSSNGRLYGLTTEGGKVTLGTLFSFDPFTSTFTKLKDLFGVAHGIANGSLYEARDGKLYGMTGDQDVGGGDIFSFDPASFSYTVVKVFDNTNGGYPSGSLTQATDGKLYGMTNYGGTSNNGVIFSFDPSSSTYTKRFDFGSNETGSSVCGALIKASNGKLYGMTNQGGSDGHGIIFYYDPLDSTLKKIKDFDYTKGGNPFGSLIQATDGKLYGMTHDGGSSDYGVIFSFDPSTSSYTKLHDFNYLLGGHPFGSLMQASDGKLYGMTNDGVSGVFSIDPSSSTFIKLKDFDAVITGYNAYGSLIQASDENLYGMTENGGANGLGAIFSFNPFSSVLSKVMDFDGTNGSQPYGSLIQASDGKLYGMTSSGGSKDSGVIFSFTPSTSAFKKLKDFNGADGANPLGNLKQASDGKLYGMTTRGGRNDLGVIFSFDPSTSTYTKLKDYTSANGANPNIGSAFIEVYDSLNKPPTVHLSIAYNILKYSAPARIKLNATATDTDGKITKVQFFKDSAKLHTETKFPYGFLWDSVPVGNYTLTAKAYDNSGNVATSNTISVSVIDSNVAPVVKIVSPAHDTTYTGPATIRLIAQAHDANDKIRKVEFYSGKTLIRTEFIYPYTFTWKDVQRGTYNITAKAYDDKGLSAISEQVKVTVTNATIVASKPSSRKTINISLSVRPNPVKHILQIYTKGLQPNKSATISITSISGVVVKTIHTNALNQVMQLDVSSLISGVYVVKVVSDDKVIYTQFVKL